MVGNKVDMPDREVLYAKGHAKAKEWGASFLETSAKTRVSVPRVHPIVKSVLLLSMSCIVVKIVVISHV